jgi:hypothetical protein
MPPKKFVGIKTGDGVHRRTAPRADNSYSGKAPWMVAIPALYPGKAVVQVATVQVAVNDLLEVRYGRQNPYGLSKRSS